MAIKKSFGLNFSILVHSEQFNLDCVVVFLK